MNVFASVFGDTTQPEVTLGGTVDPTAVTSSIDSVMGPVRALFMVIGIVIILLVVFKVAKAFAKGDFGSVVKVGIGGVVAAVLCFNLNLPISIINDMGNLAQKVFNSAGQIADTESGSGSGTSSSSTGQ